MTLNTAHLIETALLVLAAYLLGCVLGFGIRRVLYAARGTRQVTAVIIPTVVATAEIKRPRSPAARLAATVDHDILPTPSAQQASLSRTAVPPIQKSIAPKPPGLSAPRGGVADNLKQIKGIGPKIEASLNGLGIYHLDQISLWTKANVDWVDSQLASNGRIRRERWVEQATAMVKPKAEA